MQKIMLCLAMFAIVGCQSKKEAVVVICDAPNQADIAIPEMKAQTLAESFSSSKKRDSFSEYISSNLKNAEMSKLFQSMASMKPDARQAALRDAMEETGVTECAMLDIWSTPKPETTE